MANVFEQLENLDSVSEPRQAFENVVCSMLLDCGIVDGRVKVFRGDGGIDAFKGELAKASQLIVYQTKYFTKPWGESQKKQIRDSFTTVSKAFRLEKWFLCTPSCPTKEDLQWFHTWRKKKAPTTIELIDGDKLIGFLHEPGCTRVRERLRKWGVLSVPGGVAIIQTHTRCIKLSSLPVGPKFRCSVMMRNDGDITAEDLRITFRYSQNNAFPGSVNEAFWEKIKSSAMLVPSRTLTLKSKFGLHPGEPHEIIQIPLDSIGTSPFPFTMSIEYWVKNQQSGRQSLTIDIPIETETTLQFKPDETEKETEFASDIGVVLPDLEYPTNGPLIGILDQIAAHSVPIEFGFIDLGADSAEPDRALFRPHLSQTGEIKRMSREALTWALQELVNLGWLQPLDSISGPCRYLLTDAAKHSTAFRKQVDYYKSLREKQR